MLEKINPNHLTTLRLLLTPLIMYLLLANSFGSLAVCLALMVAAELTDFFDGHIARKYNKISDLGKIYDPMCDAIYHLTIFICLITFGLSVWIVAAFAVRDLIVAYSRAHLALGGTVLAARGSGKAKAAGQLMAQLVFVIYLLLVSAGGSSGSLARAIWHYGVYPTMAIALVVTLYSLFDYLLYVDLESHRQKYQAGKS